MARQRLRPFLSLLLGFLVLLVGCAPGGGVVTIDCVGDACIEGSAVDTEPWPDTPVPDDDTTVLDDSDAPVDSAEPVTEATPEDHDRVPAFDTTWLDPYAGDVGGSPLLTCLTFPVPGAVVRGEHGSSRAIDLDCAIGDPVRNPFPVTAMVVEIVDRWTAGRCFASEADYVAHHAEFDAGNNLVRLQVTIGGRTWVASLLHVEGTDLHVGDLVAPGAYAADCGNVGYTCALHGGDGSHVHLALSEDGVWTYPGDLLASACASLEPPPDLTPPTVVASSPAGGWYPAGAPVSVAWTTTEVGGGVIAGHTVALHTGTCGVGSAGRVGAEVVLGAAARATTWTLPAWLDLGPAWFKVAAVDDAGNWGFVCAPLQVAAAPDTVAPTIRVTAPSGGTYAPGATVGVAWSRDEAAASQAIAVLSGGCSSGAVEVAWVTPSAAATSSAVVLPGTLATGTYAVRVRATDPAGNTGSGCSATFRVERPDVTPPSVTVSGPGASTYAPGDAVLVDLSASDDVGVTSLALELRAGTCSAGRVGSSRAVPVGGGTTTWTLDGGLAAGTYVLAATALDAVGHATTACSTAFSVAPPSPTCGPDTEDQFRIENDACPTLTAEGNVLRGCGELLAGNRMALVVTKADGSDYSSTGTMKARVGARQVSGDACVNVERGSEGFRAGDHEVVVEFDLVSGSWPAGTTKEFFASYGLTSSTSCVYYTPRVRVTRVCEP